MRIPKPYINGFKDRRAFSAFMAEAMTLEFNISRNITHGHYETIYLFVNDKTGHIITWYRENDPAAQILDELNGRYSKIPWQVRGTIQ